MVRLKILYATLRAVSATVAAKALAVFSMASLPCLLLSRYSSSKAVSDSVKGTARIPENKKTISIPISANENKTSLPAKATPRSYFPHFSRETPHLLAI